MTPASRSNQTAERRQTMLHTAFCPVVRAALEAEDTIEVLANPDGSIWIERIGHGVQSTGKSLSSADRERVIRLVASSTGDSCDRASPIVSAELPGSGERFEGCLPPVSEAPCFAIRKPAATPFTLGDYISQGTLSPAMALDLRAALQDRSNILIAGGTSSGKTTFTNALLAEPAIMSDRVVILEDTRELKCAAPDVVALRTHKSVVTLQHLVRSTLRLRPDRIVVGEVRGGEALDLLKAWNTGHPGGITTLHANSAHAALTRLEHLVCEASPRVPHELIADAIDVVIFMSRVSGARRIEEAIRVTGFDGESYQTEPLTHPRLSIISKGVSP